MRFDKHYFSEVDKYCIELYQKRFPDAIALGDITKIESMPDEDYIVTGGFPCQPFSVAGKRKGEKDERNMWPEMLRVIRLCKPSWVVCENVPGAIKYIKGVVKPDLENEGYEVWPFSISAATVGAPHLRKRIWIMAYPRCWSERGEEKSKRTYNKSDRRSSMQYGKRYNGVESGELSDPDRKHDDNSGHGASEICRERSEKAEVQGSEDVPYPQSIGDEERGCEFNEAGATVANTAVKGLEGQESESKLPRGQQGLFTERCGWESEPAVGQLVDGLPASLGRFEGRLAIKSYKRVNQLKGLGNAVLPQIPELLFRQIKEIIGG